jgi:hypothetical protein
VSTVVDVACLATSTGSRTGYSTDQVAEGLLQLLFHGITS